MISLRTKSSSSSSHFSITKTLGLTSCHMQLSRSHVSAQRLQETRYV
jgi:hypothetical protein